MTLPSPIGQAQLYKESYEEFRAYHPRARTLSMYSVGSGKSSSSSLSATSQSPYATPATEVQLGHSAWGSFVPSTSAAVSLRQFVSPAVKRSASISGTRPLNDTDDDDSRSSYIQPTRTISSPPGLPTKRTSRPSPFFPGPPSGTSSSASSIHLDVPSRTSSDLHPVLARLERGSKLCGQMVCATCHKSGRDFPQCGKCKKMWCSRECRLVNGKRHKC